MKTWRCFGCNAEKSSLNDSCSICDPYKDHEVETQRVEQKIVQNNVNVYGDMPFSASLAEENERLYAELEQKNRPGKYESPDYGYSLGMKLFGFTITGIVWTGLAIIWICIGFLGWVVLKATT